MINGKRNRFIFTLFSITAVRTPAIISATNDYALPGGERCQHHWECFSGHCDKLGESRSFCAPAAAINGTVSAGGDCLIDADCFSNHCADGTCASDSRIPHYVAGGGPCIEDIQCYSSVCYKQRCAADGAEVGRTAAGGYCRLDEECFSGVCRSSRCGPDSRVVNVVPSGGHCSAVLNWCWSKGCYEGRCTAAGQPGKVADGGLCRHDYHCMNGSVCRHDICVSRGAADQDERGTKTIRLRHPGERCANSSHCSAAFCIRGHCAAPSPANRTLVADGGQCDSDGQCQSGQCDDLICATSFADHRSVYTAAAGASCRKDEHCYSGVCFNGICSAESPAPLEKGAVLIFSPDWLDKTSFVSSRGFVAGGGFCHQNEHCYSGLCHDSICAPDGPGFGTIADGGICELDHQCYSGYCRNGKCITSFGGGGKVAPGGACDEERSQCAQAYLCLDGRCIKEDDQPRNGYQAMEKEFHSLRLREGPCNRHAQCNVGRCLYKRCTAEWFLSDTTVSTSSPSSRILPVFGLYVTAVLSFCTVSLFVKC